MGTEGRRGKKLTASHRRIKFGYLCCCDILEWDLDSEVHRAITLEFQKPSSFLG